MPVIFRERGFRFHFFSHEGNPREPVHIHVARPDADAKLWLYPEVRVAYNCGLTPRELRIVEEIVRRRREEIERGWTAIFAGSD
ncbi:DUF4160 domain-containing protein [Sphingomonas sp. Tas61C01]|uniref:DUF4160 domain-containing protein n=1 Tax=Sphingomonas sp. Tas61C01 TaxID=3458297 RepID=UPI00403EDC1C